MQKTGAEESALDAKLSSIYRSYYELTSKCLKRELAEDSQEKAYAEKLVAGVENLRYAASNLDDNGNFDYCKLCTARGICEKTPQRIDATCDEIITANRAVLDAINDVKKPTKGFGFQVHITDRCDQRCRHCYLWADGKSHGDEMTAGQFAGLLENVFEFEREHNKEAGFAITGGNPLLHPDFMEIAKLLHQAKRRWAILGNPEGLTEEVCQLLYIYGCRKYQLSLDGLEEFHDSRRKAGSFAKTIAAIRMLQKAGIQGQIMATVSKSNIDEIPKLMDFLAVQKPNCFAFARFCPQDKAENKITPDEYKALLEKCFAKLPILEKAGVRFNFKDHLWELFFYEKYGLGAAAGTPQGRIYGGCNMGRNHLTILPNLDVYACRRMKSKVGNAGESKLSDIWRSAAMLEYRQIRNKEKCAECVLEKTCRGCPSVAQGYAGDWRKPDPQCWLEQAGKMKVKKENDYEGRKRKAVQYSL